jgi:hypothetical protein
VECNNDVFGDPAVGVNKACSYASAGKAPPPGATVPVPTNIANGTTVSLQCGTTYQGTLQLNGKSKVTVRTVGGCGKASITPGRAITGWTKYHGNIYVAPVDFVPVQVEAVVTQRPFARTIEHPQFDGWYGSADATVTNSTVSNTGMLNMPSPSHAGIMFTTARSTESTMCG